MTMTGAGSSFGAQLRQLRVAAGLTQEELAERAGLTANAIGAVERGGRRHPYPRTIKVLADALSLSPAERAALSAMSTPRDRVLTPEQTADSSLPVPATPLVGRESVVANAVALLQRSGIRLLTMTGPGGVGKTRLALGVATEMSGEFADGVRFVSLAAITDPKLVPTAIMHALDLRSAAKSGSYDLIARYLSDRNLLLVLDNFEQTLGASPAISDLLRRCPLLKIVVTSRIALRIDGEQEFPVSPLPLSARGVHLSLPELAVVPAVALFVERARAVRPEFALSEGNSRAVIELCAVLDGLPLAIELAAAWSRMLSPQAILEHFNHRLMLLTGGGPDRPARHQTMRGAVEWSFHRLDPAYQALFRRLCVFEGGFTLAAAEGVASPGEEMGRTSDALGARSMPTFSESFLGGVMALVDHSLLQRGEEPDGETRIRILETIREYGSEHLVAAGEEESVRQGHALWFLNYATDARKQLEGPERATAHVRVRRELDNLRAALSWLHERGDAERAQRLAAEAARFWITGGNIGEGRSWIDRVLAMPGASACASRFDALYWGSILAVLQEATTRAIELAEEAVALARASGDQMGTGMALAHLGDAAGFTDLDAAQALVEQSLAIFQGLHEPFREATAFRQLGLIAFRRGEYDRATEHHTTALTICRRIEHPWGVPISLRSLAETAFAQGNLRAAQAQYQESLMRWRTLGERLHTSDCLYGLARVSLASGDADTAISLLGAQDALDQSMGYVHTRDVHTSPKDEARSVVTAGRFDEMWAHGQSLTLDEVLDAVMTLPMPADPVSQR